MGTILGFNLTWEYAFMEEMVTLSMQLHLIFVFLFVVLLGINLYLLKSDKTFFNLSKRLELLAPQYYIVLAAIFFTGLIVMAVRQFSFSWAVWEMIAVWIVLIAFGIRGHKAYKKVKRSELSSAEYKAFALRKYSIDLALVALTLILFYGVH